MKKDDRQNGKRTQAIDIPAVPNQLLSPKGCIPFIVFRGPMSRQAGRMPRKQEMAQVRVTQVAVNQH